MELQLKEHFLMTKKIIGDFTDWKYELLQGDILQVVKAFVVFVKQQISPGYVLSSWTFVLILDMLLRCF